MTVIPKALTILGYRAFVNSFFKKFPQHKAYKQWSPKPFTKLIHAFHEEFVNAVIENREGADLPLKMGNIKIISYKTHKRYPNFKNYLKGEPVTSFTNNHTNGLNCRIIYSNKSGKYRVKDKNIWGFDPERPFQLKVSRAFVNNFNRYTFSPNTSETKIKNIEAGRKHLIEKKVSNFLQTYNEFEV